MPEMEVDRPGGRRDRVPVDYPSNSQKSKQRDQEQRPKVGKVVEGEVTQRRRGIFNQVMHNFIQEDRTSLAEYIVMDVLLPAAKTTIDDVISQGIRRMLYGDDRPRQSGRGGSTPYAAMSRFARSTDPRPPMSRQAKATHDFSDVIITSRGDVEEVIGGLRELINLYNVASVADFYELVGLTGDFTDNKWGWENLDEAGYRLVRGGYVLTLPATKPISS